MSEIDKCLNCPYPECIDCFDKVNRPRRQKRKFTTSEIEYITTHPDMSASEIARNLNRDRNIITALKRKLGLINKGNSDMFWTKEEDEIVASYTVAETVALLPHRTKAAIYMRRTNLRKGVVSNGTT